MTTLTKSFNPNDYNNMRDIIDRINGILPEMNGKYDLQHEHRKWEYGLALRFLRELGGVRSVLDIGAGNSPFSYILHRFGYEVSSADIMPVPAVRPSWPATIRWYNLEDSKDLPSFDVVISIGTIEHISDDKEALEYWWGLSKKGMFVTYDCTETGERLVKWHLRTYTVEQAVKMIEELPEASVFGEVDSHFHGRLVRAGGVDGSFGSVAVERKKIRKRRVTKKKEPAPLPIVEENPDESMEDVAKALEEAQQSIDSDEKAGWILDE